MGQYVCLRLLIGEYQWDVVISMDNYHVYHTWPSKLALDGQFWGNFTQFEPISAILWSAPFDQVPPTACVQNEETLHSSVENNPCRKIFAFSVSKSKEVYF